MGKQQGNARVHRRDFEQKLKLKDAKNDCKHIEVLLCTN